MPVVTTLLSVTLIHPYFHHLWNLREGLRGEEAAKISGERRGGSMRSLERAGRTSTQRVWAAAEGRRLAPRRLVRLRRSASPHSFTRQRSASPPSVYSTHCGGPARWPPARRRRGCGRIAQRRGVSSARCCAPHCTIINGNIIRTLIRTDHTSSRAAMKGLRTASSSNTKKRAGVAILFSSSRL